MKKEDLLKELRNSSKIMLKPSVVHGIGVFSIAPIKKGEQNIFSNNTQKWIPISKEEMNSLPLHAKLLIENYCLYDDTRYFVPEEGLKILDLVVFLNHCENPNIISIEGGIQFEALRDIEPGEELFIDYGTLVEEES